MAQFHKNWARSLTWARTSGLGVSVTAVLAEACKRMNVPYRSRNQARQTLIQYAALHNVPGVVVKGVKANKVVVPRALRWVISDDFLKSYEWRKLRMEVLIEQGRRCACCGATPQDGRCVHVDHIKPRRVFPELALEKTNLQVLCEDCNHGKGNWDHTDWRQKAAVNDHVDELDMETALVWFGRMQ
jgi:5-methylcytosine-specific restriction endonuclease McrA